MKTKKPEVHNRAELEQIDRLLQERTEMLREIIKLTQERNELRRQKFCLESIVKNQAKKLGEYIRIVGRIWWK